MNIFGEAMRDIIALATEVKIMSPQSFIKDHAFEQLFQP